MKENIRNRFNIHNFSEFTYAKRSHWELFSGLDIELYGEKASPDFDVLKRYQDLLTLLFIRTYIPVGSRILEVNGGLSRILAHLHGKYECWNADKFEGLGNGPKAPNNAGYRLVRDYVGNFNPELPDNYFDFVFSISALEHVPQDDPDFHKRVIDDINRVLKIGGYSMHLLDFVINGKIKRQNPFIEFCYGYSKSINTYIPAEQACLDPDFYYMSEAGYKKYWQWLTKKSYAEFGTPSNYTILWQKTKEATSPVAYPAQHETASSAPISSLRNENEVVVDESFFHVLRASYTIVAPTKKNGYVNKDEAVVLSVIDNARIAIHWNFDGKIEVLDQNATSDLGAPLISGPTPSTITLKNRSIIDTIYIVTPSINSAKFIDRTIQSVVMQEGDFYIRYHVQDACSKDGTVEKLEQWEKVLNNPGNKLINCRGVDFSWDSSPDKGMYDAITKGVAFIDVPDNGILTWINSDDTFLPGAFSTVHAIMSNNDDAFWVVGAVNVGGENGQELGFNPTQYPVEIIREGLCDGEHWAFIQQEGSFWMGALWHHAGGLNTSLKLCGDWDLWRRFAMHTSPVHVLWGLGRFRKRPGQLTSQIDRYFAEMNEVIPREERIRVHRSISKTVVEKTKVVTRPDYDTGYRYRTILLSRNLTPRIARNPHYAEEFHKYIDEASRNTKEQQVRVLTFCTLDHGGAGTGSLRRIMALRELGIDARMMTFVNRNHEVPTGRIEPALDATNTRDQLAVWQSIHRNVSVRLMNDKNFKGHEFFSSADAAMTFHQLRPLIRKRDVVHLHWVVGMVDFETMGEVMRGRPFAWTLADMNAFTGGCHYSEGCDEFIRECRNCPLFDGKSDIPHKTWKRKKAAYKNLDIHFVCPSKYIAELARKSSLIGDKKIHIIPNAYPIDLFRPIKKTEARKQLGLPMNKKLILFGADSVSNLRKGGDILKRSMDHLTSTHPKQQIEAVFFGNGKLDLSVHCYSMGASSPERLALIYSAVDVFVSPSREDVGPMTVCESLLCGTPVVGFPIGILPEVAEHKSTAYFTRKFDHEDLASGILWALEAVKTDSGIAARCRARAVNYAAPQKCAERHKHVYELILGTSIEANNHLPTIAQKKAGTQFTIKNKQNFKNINELQCVTSKNCSQIHYIDTRIFSNHQTYAKRIQIIANCCTNGDYSKARALFLELKEDYQKLNHTTLPNLASILKYFDLILNQ